MTTEHPEQQETDATQARVAHVLEDELRRIDSPDKAEAAIAQVERMARGQTEAEAGDRVAVQESSAAATVERVAEEAPPRKEAAAVLATTAAETAAETPEAEAVVRAAQEALRPGTAASPEVRRGRSLLRQAALRRMAPLEALDARLFLAVNSLPHPPLLDRAANTLTVVTTGGWIWALIPLARLARGKQRRRVLRVLLLTLAGTTWIVEHPVKAYFRRQRPFIDVVRALVVGKRPGSWSFPSGHTASSFAAAWLLGRVWPRWRSLYYGLAATVGLSRVYVGAHYPGDVASGALIGTALAEGFRRLVKWLA